MPVKIVETSASVLLLLRESNTIAAATNFVGIRFDKYQNSLTIKYFDPPAGKAIEDILIIEDDNMIAASVLYSNSDVEIFVT